MGKLYSFLRIYDIANILVPNIAVALLFLAFFPFQEGLRAFLLFPPFYFLALVFISLANSIGDEADDKNAGKALPLRIFPKQAAFFLLFAAGLGFLAIGYFSNQLAFLSALLLFAFTIIYSLKPFRLKGRGFLGVTIAALGLGPVPFLFFLSFATINSQEIFFLAWLFSRQIFVELFHQLCDLETDKKNGTKTFAVWAGKKATKNILGILFMALIIATALPLFILGAFGMAVSLGLFALSFRQMADAAKVIYEIDSERDIK
ncbi:MAG: UbiA family prenyltransferase [archaeon]|nr:UbiA family prenyltransferase [archaeon]